MSRIHFLALGGTIAAVPLAADAGGTAGAGGGTAAGASGSGSGTGGSADAGGTAGGVVPQVGAREIAAAAALDTLPAGSPEVTFEQLAQVGSGAITLDHLASAVRAARAAAADGATAVVLTQGTDTLEETAFALSVMNDSGIPIVLTGAMRGPSLPGAEGGANVRSAVVTALDEQVSFLPAVLVMGDEVHDPTFARKAHTTSPATFSSGPAAGPLGWVSEDHLVMAHMPARVPSPFKVPEAAAGESADGALAPSPAGPASGTADSGEATQGVGSYPRVALIEVGLGESLDILRFLPQAGYSGAVIAGVGGGHVPSWALDRVQELAGAMPVVYASRTGSGRTLERTYGYPGGELDLQRLGLIPAGVLDARKARLLLTLALASQVPAEHLGDVFGFYRA